MLPLGRWVSAVFSLVCTVGFAGSLGVTTHQFLLELVERSSCRRDFGRGVLYGSTDASDRRAGRRRRTGEL